MRTDDFKAFDVAYDASGRVMIVWGRERPVDGGVSNSTEFTTRPLGGSLARGKVIDSSPAGPIVLAPEPAASRFALSFIEYYDCPPALPDHRAFHYEIC